MAPKTPRFFSEFECPYLVDAVFSRLKKEDTFYMQIVVLFPIAYCSVTVVGSRYRLLLRKSAKTGKRRRKHKTVPLVKLRFPIGFYGCNPLRLISLLKVYWSHVRIN